MNECELNVWKLCVMMLFQHKFKKLLWFVVANSMEMCKNYLFCSMKHIYVVARKQIKYSMKHSAIIL